ncbi:MAG: hypothetical protein Q4D04_05550 [Clostridia bacterium]|nr:hypothetical protein [Clostridia bacterium]
MADDFRPRAIWEWLTDCPHIKDLYFSFGEIADGNTVLVPLTAYKDRAVTEFIDGSSIRECDFALVRFEAMTTEPNDAGNLAAQFDVESLAAWIDEQGKAGNFPEFPPSCKIQKLYALPTETGFLAAQDESGARYMLQFRIEYYYEE